MANQITPFVYKCKLKSVTDGDTVRLETIDLGFSVQLHNKAKRQPERTREKELGLLAKAKVKEWLVGDITLKSYGIDKYGRVLGEIFCDKGNIGELLQAEGLAVPYDGGTKTKVWE